MGVASRKFITALLTVLLLSGVGIVSAEAKISGPTMDCPFSLLPMLRLPTGTTVVFCGTNGGAFTAK